MKVLAVVVTYGSVPPLEECLRALGNQSLHIQTMVVDNGGSAEVAKLCASLGVRYVDPGANLGYGRAVNLGVALSKDTDYLLVINPDVIVRDLNVLYRLLSTSNASIVSCQLERP